MAAMRVTTAQMRQIVTNPGRFVEDARAPRDAGERFGNPQRAWMEAALRAYFANGRSAAVLWDELETRASTGGLTPWRYRMALAAEPMVEQFLAWDRERADAPGLWFPPTRDVQWHEHTLALKRDLVYLTPTGYRLLLLWTDRELRVTHADAGLMAAAILAYSDGDLGTDRVESIEVWQLRAKQQAAWTRQELEAETARLHQRLDQVALQLA
jgi:hypothetical protein